MQHAILRSGNKPQLNTYVHINNYDWSNLFDYSQSWGVNIIHLDEENSLQQASVQRSYIFSPLLTNQKWNASEFFQNNFIRFNYSYEHKLIVTVKGKYNGTIDLNNQSNYSFYPSIYAGWVASMEPYIVSIKSINFLKFYLQYGRSGNQNIDNLIPSSQPVSFLPSAKPGNLINRYIKLNLGMDFILFNQRIQGDVIYFSSKTMDPGRNEAEPLQNLVSSGTECNLDVRLINKPGLSWSVDGNVTFPKLHRDKGNAKYNSSTLPGLVFNELPVNFTPNIYGGFSTDFRLANCDLYLCFHSNDNYMPSPYTNSIGQIIPGNSYFFRSTAEPASLVGLNPLFYSKSFNENTRNSMWLQNVTINYRFPGKIFNECKLKVNICADNLVTFSTSKISSAPKPAGTQTGQNLNSFQLIPLRRSVTLGIDLLF